MKKCILICMIIVATVSCNDSGLEVDRGNGEVTEKADIIGKEEKGRIDFEKRQWLVEEYVTKETFKSKELSKTSYSDSRVRDSDDIRMEVLVDDEGFSFKIFPKGTYVNRNHIGGYRINASNERKEEINFERGRSGRAVILKERDGESYEIFDEFFKRSQEVRITVRDGYVQVYRGTLDTTYY